MLWILLITASTRTQDISRWLLYFHQATASVTEIGAPINNEDFLKRAKFILQESGHIRRLSQLLQTADEYAIGALKAKLIFDHSPLEILDATIDLLDAELDRVLGDPPSPEHIRSRVCSYLYAVVKSLLDVRGYLTEDNGSATSRDIASKMEYLRVQLPHESFADTLTHVQGLLMKMEFSKRASEKELTTLLDGISHLETILVSIKTERVNAGIWILSGNTLTLDTATPVPAIKVLKAATATLERIISNELFSEEVKEKFTSASLALDGITESLIDDAPLLENRHQPAIKLEAEEYLCKDCGGIFKFFFKNPEHR